MEIFRKAIVGFKDALEGGQVIAMFARLNVVDHDGDKAIPGFIGKQTVAMLPAHNWQSVTLGKGGTREQGDEVLAELKMNLEIPAAKDWHSAIKFDLANGDPIQEWSYGFTILPGGAANGDMKEFRRLLQPLADGKPGGKVHEVSPVLVGAGKDTFTMAAKGLKFCEEVESVLGAAVPLIVRAKSLAELRAKEGRTISATSRTKLDELKDSLKSMLDEVSKVASDDEARKMARLELRRHLLEESGIQERQA